MPVVSTGCSSERENCEEARNDRVDHDEPNIDHEEARNDRIDHAKCVETLLAKCFCIV